MRQALRRALESLPLALDHHRAGRLAEAEKVYRAILRQDPRQLDALHLLSQSLNARGLRDEGMKVLRRALMFWPSNAQLHCTLGGELFAGRQLEAALAAYDQALALDPALVEALANRGNLLQDMGRHAQAVSDYDAALANGGRLATIVSSRANALHALGRYEEARYGHEEAVALAPRDPAVWCNLALHLSDRDEKAAALTALDRALELAPGHPVILSNRGNVLEALERFDEALADLDAALAKAPDAVGAWLNKGAVCERLSRFDEALACYTEVLARQPASVKVLNNLGSLLPHLRRFDEAAAIFERLVALAPDHDGALGGLLANRLRSCDWRDYEALLARIHAGVDAGRRVALPFVGLLWARSAEDDYRLATGLVRQRHPARVPLWQGRPFRHKRIRLAYVCADFRDHVTPQLMAGVFEAHDRERFETFAISFGGHKPGDAMRARLEGAFDHFLDVRALGPAAIARLMREHEIDIAVDLNGHTGSNRLDIFAHRPAPVQVNFLGYPGTSGAPYLDYILADRHLIPDEERRWYTEQVVHLPVTYQPNDDKRPIDAGVPDRAACGLPDEGFVFCSFNNAFKITPLVFDCWMRLLRDVPGSVLWLLKSKDSIEDALRREAEARGVEAHRLVFAPHIPQAENLARMGRADLFLDTLPFNAHTTASDALWAGLPLLTCTGSTFAGRVATSVLLAMDLPELVTSSLADYETRALQLARDQALLAGLRDRLARNRVAGPLFDTRSYTQGLEQAFVTMWQRAEAGLPPVHFAVAG